MKKILCLALSAIILASCTGKKEQNTEAQSSTYSASGAFNLNPDFFMLSADSLPATIDLNQDISGYDYQSLRLLRSYVYATHGHYFVEGDLNTFFDTRCSWYLDRQNELCFGEKDHELSEKYVQMLWEDYPKSYELIQLTDEEKAFVTKIDARMDELMKQNPYVTNKEGVQLLNPNLLVNWHQIYQPEPEFKNWLWNQNVAFMPTKHEQLFNVYEENDYHLMPNFVTTDIMLQAYHMYFSYVLKTLERHVFVGQLTNIFQSLTLQNSQNMNQLTENETLGMAEFRVAAYCAVALKILGRNVRVPEQIEELVNREYELVMKAEDDLSPLFQTDFDFPYSLFRPRGHYSRTEADKTYFRAMMWLQKGSFFREKRFQLAEAIYIASLINQMPKEDQQAVNNLNTALTFLMGEPDNISIIEVAAKLREMNIHTAEKALADATIEAIDSWLQEGFKGRNSISPKVAAGPVDQLNFMPQRYTFDAEIMGNMFDEVPNSLRAYPRGLDIFSVLGVKGATALLDTCYHSSKEWGDYQKTHDEMKAKLGKFNDWDKTFYNKWFENLVVLQKQDKSQPGFMQTSVWEKKNLNTALASYALLKHDAILYAEQPFGAECGGGQELPDPDVVGYVEPNIPFWKKLKETIALNRKMLTDSHLMTDELESRTSSLEEYVDLCLRVAEQEMSGQPISAEDKGSIRIFGSSMEYFTLSVLDPDEEIWEWSLVSGADRKVAQVADVFTRNINGCEKDGILYEASGYPHAIYVVVEIGGKYYLTRGAVYSYHEFVRPLSAPRLTDEEWQDMLDSDTAPATTEWFAPMLLGKPVVNDERYVYSTGC